MMPPRGPLIAALLLLTAAAPDVPSPPQGQPTTPAQTAPQTQASSPSPAASTEPRLPPSVVLQSFGPQAAMPVLGHRVVGPDGQDVARLVDVLVGPDGRPIAAVLDFGGFMGVGNRKIAVHWDTLRFEPGDATHRIILTLTPDEFRAAPEYKDPEKPAPVVVPAPVELKPAGPQSGSQ
jgi:hypothetical protein